MKMRFQHIIPGILLLTFFTACSKGGGTAQDDGSGSGPHEVIPYDVTAPVLDITTPTTGQVYNSGNTIIVSGKIADDYGLYRGSVRIVNDANGQMLKEQLYEIHGIKSYDFNVNQVVTVPLVTDYTVTVSFEDHGSNVTTKTVKIKVNP